MVLNVFVFTFVKYRCVAIPKRGDATPHNSIYTKMVTYIHAMTFGQIYTKYIFALFTREKKYVIYIDTNVHEWKFT